MFSITAVILFQDMTNFFSRIRILIMQRSSNTLKKSSPLYFYIFPLNMIQPPYKIHIFKSYHSNVWPTQKSGLVFKTLLIFLQVFFFSNIEGEILLKKEKKK